MTEPDDDGIDYWPDWAEWLMLAIMAAAVMLATGAIMLSFFPKG